MKILVVGISVRAMAESAVHGGYPVIALDAFGDRDLRELTEAYSLRHDFHEQYSSGALYRASRQLAFDAVAYTSNLENHPEILSRFAGRCRIIGNSPRVMRSVRCWPTLFAKLRQAGFSVPETVFADEERNVDSSRRWLVKPVLSGGGHGVAFLRGKKPRGGSFMIQEFVPGRPCSASFVANGRKSVIIGVAEQLTGIRQFGSQGFRYCGSLLPLPEALNPEKGDAILEQVRGLAAFLAGEYGLTGVNGIDFILNGDRVWLTEVNPRYSASMELVEQAYELPGCHLHAEAVLEGKLPEFKLEIVLKKERFFGKAILFAERDVIAPDTQSWRARDVRDVPAAREKLRARSPVCTILASRATYDETFADLINRAAVLKKEVYG